MSSCIEEVIKYRQKYLDYFYCCLKDLQKKQKLMEITEKACPHSGVYFLFEDKFEDKVVPEDEKVPVADEDNDEKKLLRKDGKTPRVTWIGESGNLCKRLNNHKAGHFGNSAFRKSVLWALMNKENRITEKKVMQCILGKSKKKKNKISEETKASFLSKWGGKISCLIQKNVSFLCLCVSNEAERLYIEGRAIALLSNYYYITDPLPCNEDWLGNNSDDYKIKKSLLWNIKDIDEHYNEEQFCVLIEKMKYWIGKEPQCEGCCSPQSNIQASPNNRTELSENG